MPIYSPGSDELIEQVQEAAERYHPELVEAGLRVDVLEARPKTDDAGDPVEEALRHHGYGCYATIKICGPKERGAGRGDCLLTVDAYRWPELGRETQMAILDHELTHLELIRSAKGAIKLDDYERPRLGIRLHDIQYGWFQSVAARHGMDSIEVQQAGHLLTRDENAVFVQPHLSQPRKAG
jgi:hypothetical protein